MSDKWHFIQFPSIGGKQKQNTFILFLLSFSLFSSLRFYIWTLPLYHLYHLSLSLSLSLSIFYFSTSSIVTCFSIYHLSVQFYCFLLVSFIFYELIWSVSLCLPTFPFLFPHQSICSLVFISILSWQSQSIIRLNTWKGWCVQEWRIRRRRKGSESLLIMKLRSAFGLVTYLLTGAERKGSITSLFWPDRDWKNWCLRWMLEAFYSRIVRYFKSEWLYNSKL